ncbi:MAG: MotA/TolQ/ExbB proton channel family protein [Advenella sp.]|jgi:biopolymer transport protein ExbB|uniref:MotA/TolQ/ExbB proton channel family protein n=1 Tax=Advenella TaxID=290425 RepID=UPI0016AE79BC|nr:MULTISPECIES: MotA/TolQ/ExbB proton channel family protein [Advenella]MDD3757377.1 MotA/TolQ/ExbB proton channel family protein [Advenella sp.]NLN68358.1 MotA/TolQ/ExbB proton channel family protein [Alcaligenaceae bacterium]WKU18693.1 MotA/TolQ/ExbB proton channel family protein [Advenella alkanexedens]
MISSLLTSTFGSIAQIVTNTSENGSVAAATVNDAAGSAVTIVPGAAVELVNNMAANAATTVATDAGTSQMLGFLMQSDAVGKTLFGVLVFMSLLTWYLIVVKGLLNWRASRHSKAFLSRFWNASSLEQVDKDLHKFGATDPFSRLANQALHAREHHAKYGVTNLSEVGSNADFVTRTMRKVIDEETAHLENGLTILGSVGSTAPFVGLFGTVWGVYHALVNIGMSDGISINKIAGPVGEALIMTGLGLAVAIPAVLAYNAFVRRNRVVLASLDGFAYDLFAFVTTGQQVEVSSGKVRALRSNGTH